MSSLLHTLKSAVSQDLIRLQEDSYDLDLTYINDRIIAMGFPASGVEGYFRNHIDDIVRFLNHKHKNHFKVFNLSDRKYKSNINKIDIGFPDHHSPPLILLFEILLEINRWLRIDPHNVAVIHCLAGRGRTGTIIVAYLLFSGVFDSIDTALNFYAEKRSHKKQGVSQPSQVRYTHYVDRSLSLDPALRIYPKPKRLRLLNIRIGPMPKSINKQRLVFHLYSYTHKENIYLFKSDAPNRVKLNYIPKYERIIIPGRDIILVGDICFKILYVGGLVSTKPTEIVRLIYHTGLEYYSQWNKKDTIQMELESPIESSCVKIQYPNTDVTKDIHATLHSLRSHLLEYCEKNDIKFEDLIITDENGEKVLLDVSLLSLLGKYKKIIVTLKSKEEKEIDESLDSAEDHSTSNKILDEKSEQLYVENQASDKSEPNLATFKKLSVGDKACLVFNKKDLDCAYKDTRFPEKFTIKFECQILEDEKIVEPFWNEDLYQTFIATHKTNKGIVNTESSQTKEKENEENEKHTLNENENPIFKEKAHIEHTNLTITTEDKKRISLVSNSSEEIESPSFTELSNQNENNQEKVIESHVVEIKEKDNLHLPEENIHKSDNQSSDITKT